MIKYRISKDTRIREREMWFSNSMCKDDKEFRCLQVQ